MTFNYGQLIAIGAALSSHKEAAIFPHLLKAVDKELDKHRAMGTENEDGCGKVNTKQNGPRLVTGGLTTTHNLEGDA